MCLKEKKNLIRIKIRWKIDESGPQRDHQMARFHFQQWLFAQYHLKLAKVSSKLCQISIEPFQNGQSFSCGGKVAKFRQIFWSHWIWVKMVRAKKFKIIGLRNLFERPGSRSSPATRPSPSTAPLSSSSTCRPDSIRIKSQ